MTDDGCVRVMIRAPKPADVPLYADAVRRSAEHVGRWNPVEPDGLADLLERQGPGLRTFLIVDLDTGGLVGKCNVANIVMGRFCNGALGYDSYLPFVGTGRMSEGMRLVVDRCFAPLEYGGLGLHRLEINVQPDNDRSIALAKRLGFRHEGHTPRMLFLDGAWRDHDRFALTAEEWEPLPRG
ncbi:acetyltransferase [Saccharothrix sp. ST-888]|nr:acetyltransferase [Saccharothrix sp. ST-888]